MKTFLSLFAAGFLALGGSAQVTDQTFTLRSGWNAIWLELEPSNPEIGAVFTNLPIASVWTYVAKDSPVEFIQDQTEALFNEPGWLAYFPPSRTEAFLTKLYSVHGGRAYLVKSTGNNPVTLTITGRPVVKSSLWITDSFNLRGFPVNPANLPTFATFFAGSTAHAGQDVYQLDNSGHWALVPPATVIKQGEAYWTYCSGASTYAGPSGIQMDFGDGLDFGSVLTQLRPTVINNTAQALTVCWRDKFTGLNNPFSVQAFTSNRLQWLNMPAPYCIGVAAGSTFDLSLAVRRTAFAANTYTSILEVTDNVGTRFLVPVSAERLLPARASLTTSAGVGNPRAGLWVGSATVTNVNEVNSLNPSNVTPTRSSFDLRLLVHVDANGQARLLKEVIQMWQNGTTKTNADGHIETDRPGRFVLLTDDSRLPEFRGASLRDDTSVGRRLSTAAFDFDGGPTNALLMSGAFEIGKSNRCTIALDPDFPTNPFKHRFHPDHDNLDAHFTGYRQEAYPVTRNIELHYSPGPVGRDTSSTLDYGYNTLEGTYRENISGLHRNSILARGSFHLTRVSNTPVLNQ